MSKIEEDRDMYIFECPNCKDIVQTKKNEVNCKIFRHGVYKNNFTQVPPHSPKNICDALADSGKIYGCGKPFKLDLEKKVVEICDYI